MKPSVRLDRRPPARARTLAVVALLSQTLLAATSASAHAHLVQSQPADGAVLDAPPASIRLQFDEPIEASVSGITLVQAAGSAVKTTKAVPDLADPKALSLVLPPLASGRYAARWSAVSHDGHRVKGEVSFSVK